MAALRVVVESHEKILPQESFVHWTALQQGLDVTIEVVSADRTLHWVDSPSAAFGLEELAAILPAGTYKIEVVAQQEPTSQDLVRVGELTIREPSQDDRDWAEAAESILAGRAAIGKGELEVAREKLEHGLRLSEGQSLLYWQAFALEQLGLIHTKARAFPEALRCYEQGAELFGLLESEEFRRANCLQNAGFALLVLGRMDEAIEALKPTWPVFELQGFRSGMLLTFLRLAPAYLAMGRLRELFETLERARELLGLLQANDLEALYHLERGKAMLAMSRGQDALQSYAQAVELYQSMDRSGSTLVARYGLANAAVQLGLLDRAEKVIEQALASDPQPGPTHIGLYLTRGNLRRLQSEELNDQGAVKERQEAARQDLQQALEMARELDNRRALADTLLSLAHVETLLDDPKTALEHLEEAYGLYSGIKHRSGLASSLARTAEAQLAEGELKKAWETIKPVLEEVEALRISAGRRDYRMAFFASFRQDYFAMARDILLELDRSSPDAGYREMAFEVDERRRGRELLQSLQFRGNRPPVVEQLELQELELRKRLRQLSQQGSLKADGREIRSLIDEIHRLRAERYGIPNPSPPLDIQALRAGLGPETLLLVFSLGQSRSLLWCLSQDNLDVYELPAETDIRPQIEDLRALIPGPGSRGRDQAERAAATLASTLLPTAASLDRYPRWIVVGEGDIQKVPFAALPLPGRERLVVEEHELVYFPSVAALVELRSSPTPFADNPRIVAFVDPVYQRTDERLPPSSGTEESGIGMMLPRLPVSAEEGDVLIALSNRDDNRLWSAVDANRERFGTTPWQEFDLLHLAGHAVPHPYPEMSALAFSFFDAEGKAQDGLIPALEISNMALLLDLVVLSACETGVAESIRGEGVLSLAWSFLDAGSRRVVSSLWSVDDRATADLMISFYRGLFEQEMTPAAALRQAQLQMMKRPNSTLYTWAGFTLQGNWN